MTRYQRGGSCGKGKHVWEDRSSYKKCSVCGASQKITGGVARPRTASPKGSPSSPGCKVCGGKAMNIGTQDHPILVHAALGGAWATRPHKFASSRQPTVKATDRTMNKRQFV